MSDRRNKDGADDDDGVANNADAVGASSSSPSFSLSRLAGLALTSRLEDSSYLRTIPEDAAGNSSCAGSSVGGGGGVGASSATQLRLPFARGSRGGPGDGGGEEYPSSILSDAASSTRAMVFDEEEESDNNNGGGDKDNDAERQSNRQSRGNKKAGEVSLTSMSAARAEEGDSGAQQSEESEMNSEAAHVASRQAVVSTGVAAAGASARREEGPRHPQLDDDGSNRGRCCPRGLHSIDLKSKKTRWIIGLSVGLAILIAIAIVLVSVFLKQPDPDLDDIRSVSPAPAPSAFGAEPSQSSMPTVKPTVTTAITEEFDSIISTVSYPVLFEDPSTPQSQAREWMLQEDLLLLDVLDAGPKRTAQRYACAELIYALVGTADSPDRGRRQQRMQRRLSEATSAAAGDGIGRTRRRRMQVTVDSPAYQNVSYYLHPDEEECDWIGFECDDGKPGHLVTRILLNNSLLSGSLPQEVKNITYLEELNLHNNDIVGSIPDEWFEKRPPYSSFETEGEYPLQHLFQLDLSNNQLTGTIDKRIWDLPSLRALYLNNNSLYDSIPVPDDDVHASAILQDVWLHANQLDGPFPTWMLTDFRYLRSLSIGSNSIGGAIPDLPAEQWPPKLKSFDVSFNGHTGTLPEVLLTSLPALESLYVEANELTGKLPNTTSAASTASRTSYLKNVYLHDNDFTGPVPPGFGSSWTKLEKLLLYDTDVTGVIDRSQCSSWPNLVSLVVDCDDVACDCCTECVERR